MPIIVQKYGGTSVATIERIHNVAKRIITTQQNGNQVVVIVSAMGLFTDELVSMARQITQTPHGREYDALLSTGETISAALMAMMIESIGAKSISLTGGQAGILTQDIYNKGKIQTINPSRIFSELTKGKIVIVTGFQGINSLDDITTIGRGGSDTSAVAIAAAIKASVCEIYTDVDGVYTTNPRIEPTAKKLLTVTYDEMLEMASLGAGVLHPRSVETAKMHNVIIHVRSSFNTNEGTYVKEKTTMERTKSVTGIAYDESTAKIAIKQVPDKPGVAAEIFSTLAQKSINVDMIIQSIAGNQTNDIAFTVNEDDLIETIAICEQISKKLGGGTVVSDKNVVKISIVGSGMISTPGVAAKMFSILAEENINIELISTSEIKVSCIIGQDFTQKAVQALHKAFDLAF